MADPAGPLWSMQPRQSPEVPRGAGRNEVDAFLGLKVEAEQRAERRALIRRASYDLTGLPPGPEAVGRFVRDRRPDGEAFASVVEELLASRHYGEQWGRHWLDVVRYADTAGENSDHPVPHAWRYRNWVINAFNADKPYDQFVREQLAGDLLGASLPEEKRHAALVATGYLAIARRFGHDIDKRMYLTYEDVIDNLGKAFLGLSLACARCHDHKHDPVTMADYYALYSVFDSSRFSFPGCEPKQQPRDLIPMVSEEEREGRKAWETRRLALEAEIAALDPSAASNRVRDLAAAGYRILSKGDVPEGKSVHVTKEKPIEVKVRKGEAIQLTILRQGNYGADTTMIEMNLETGGPGGESRSWAIDEVIDRLATGNPVHVHGGASWCFLDTKGDRPRLLSGFKDEVEGHSALKSLQNGGAPSVLVNVSDKPIEVWAALPGRRFFCHPGNEGPVALAWLSPVDGIAKLDLRITDQHPAPGLDGVGWRLEHFADPAMADAFHRLRAEEAKGLAMREALEAHLKNEPLVPVAYGVVEGESRPARIHRMGNHEDLGEAVPKNYPEVLGGGRLGTSSSSGRLELARRLTASDNPLTARVMVNRLWAWHFGRGLVATTNDFGRHGVPPTHPELLDYLAGRFVDSGWRVKEMHRLIMNSSAYQRRAASEGDPGDYRRFHRRRLTAEELRDSLLVAAGKLDRTPGEAHPFPPESSWGFTQHAPFADEYPTNRRSVYVMRKRNRMASFFALFDGPDPNASTGERGVTTVPTQALYFMNDPFFHQAAAGLARRVVSEPPAARLAFVCEALFARELAPADRSQFATFSRAMAATSRRESVDVDPELDLWTSYARVLLASNEFLFLD
ncbi:MAG: DUF1549 and DUF1553 domain-containing protein [Verrucomicrobiota bacterium]